MQNTSGTGGSGGGAMNETPPAVQDGTLLRSADIPARPDGLWTLAIEDLTGYSRLKIRVAQGRSWQFALDGRWCPASGTRIPGAGCLCSSATVGALVGKFGGSDGDDTSGAAPAQANPTADVNAALASMASAASPSSATKCFAIGSYCVVAVPDKFHGPLFMTMNDKPANFEGHGGSLNIQIFGIP